MCLQFRVAVECPPEHSKQPTKDRGGVSHLPNRWVSVEGSVIFTTNEMQIPSSVLFCAPAAQAEICKLIVTNRFQFRPRSPTSTLYLNLLSLCTNVWWPIPRRFFQPAGRSRFVFPPTIMTRLLFTACVGRAGGRREFGTKGFFRFLSFRSAAALK